MYIGTTDTKNFRTRMAHHRWSNRFREHTFDVVILEESDDVGIFEKESDYIAKHGTLAPNGLNLSWSGKGFGHNSPNFTTRGYRYSEESRQKMRDAWKRRSPRQKGVFHHSAAARQKMSEMRKGMNTGPRKLTPERYLELIAMWKSQPSMESVGSRTGSGVILTYLRCFCLKYAQTFGYTPEGLRRLLINERSLEPPISDTHCKRVSAI